MREHHALARSASSEAVVQEEATAEPSFTESFHCVCHQVVDFQWNPHDPWTFMSVSDDVSDELGGGTLQLWRVNDLIYRPEADVLAELDKHRSAAAATCFLRPT